ncbi:unannotated protein [freshwater metagenome]|uniref:Unannotated protein n=1 Tax=freshwater metagenome TaxID=449393 RepID=A0A6J6EXD2_9ZZZZ
MPPRTANSPRRSTRSTLANPKVDNCFANSLNDFSWPITKESFVSFRSLAIIG